MVERDETGAHVYADIPPLPIDLAFSVGEIIHNLRSSLDGVSSTIVSAITGKREERVGMPFHETYASLLSTRENSRVFRASADLYDYILEHIKPYRKDGNTLLWALNKLNNVDKHRRIMLAYNSSMMSHTIKGSEISYVGIENRYTGVQKTLIFSDPHDVEISRESILTTIVLDELEILPRCDLFQLLIDFADVVGDAGYKLQRYCFGEAYS